MLQISKVSKGIASTSTSNSESNRPKDYYIWKPWHKWSVWFYNNTAAVATIKERERLCISNKHPEPVKHTERRVIATFIQDPRDYFYATPTFNQLGEIFSVLKQMKESFKTNISDDQKEEMNQNDSEALEVVQAIRVQYCYSISTDASQTQDSTVGFASTVTCCTAHFCGPTTVVLKEHYCHVSTSCQKLPGCLYQVQEQNIVPLVFRFDEGSCSSQTRKRLSATI